MNASLWIAHPWIAWALLLPAPLGALWMALGPEVPALRARRGLLSGLTWLVTRVLFVLALRAAALPAGHVVFGGVLPHGAPPAAVGPWLAWLLAACHAAAGGPGTVIVTLVADFTAWRTLAASAGEGSETAWNWVAAPLVWYLAAFAGGAEMAGAAFVALAWALERRGRVVGAGVALALGVAFAGPLALLPALAVVLGARRRTRPGLAAAAAFALVLATAPLLHVPARAFVWPESAGFGAGPTLWCVPATLWGLDPGDVGATGATGATGAVGAVGALGGLPLALALVGGAVWLARRRAGAPAHGAWGMGAFAALVPAFAPASAILWAPLVCAWAGEDPDRRGWWLLYAVALPLAAWLDGGPLQGALGVSWQGLAALGVVAAALLALWPLKALTFDSAARATPAGTRPDLD